MRLNFMTPRRLKISAGLLLIVAVFFAWMGYQNQKHTSQTTSKALSNTFTPALTQHTLWRFIQDVSPGEKLTKDSVEQVTVEKVSPNQVQDLGQVLSLRVKRPIVSGTFLTTDMLEEPRAIVDQLPVGYRALAVKASEVSTIGGHLKPGDNVDIIYLLKPNDESGELTTARRLASNIKVLAVGEQVSDITGDLGKSERIKKEAKNQKSKSTTRAARSVVLAVEEPLAPMILLAESSGDLRLSIVGTDEKMASLKDEHPDQYATNTDDDNTSIVDSTLTSTSLSEEQMMAQKKQGEPEKEDIYLASLEQFKIDSQSKKISSKTKKKSTVSRGHYIEIIQGDKRAWINSGK
ncbi:Flp pilus assembly protein CpaB [Vibrio sp.]|uniref:Flp pilus assembly protein CpaB n=1 Tax=Vibrio sp. TaxID=678 RepID=UPI003AA86D84